LCWTTTRQILVGHRGPPLKSVILKNDLLLVFQKMIFVGRIPKVSVNRMVIEDLVVIFKIVVGW
jgi:hypothetical protein